MSPNSSLDDVQPGTVPVANCELVTWEHLEDIAIIPMETQGSTTRESRIPEAIEGYHQHVDSISSEDGSPRSYHTEDAYALMLEDTAFLKGSAAFLSCPSVLLTRQSQENIMYHTTGLWNNSGDMPARPASAVPEEFPPLTRCSQPNLPSFSCSCSYDGTPMEDESMSDDSYFPVAGRLISKKKLAASRTELFKQSDPRQDDNGDNSQMQSCHSPEAGDSKQPST